LLLPLILAKVADPALAGLAFVVLLAGWFILLYSTRNAEASFEFVFETSVFPVEPEGDLDACNGMPGSAVLDRVSGILKGEVESFEEVIQEDYGWGRYCTRSGCSIWIAVSYGGPLSGKRELPAEWTISTEHSRLLSPRQWALSLSGARVAEEIRTCLLDAFRKDPAIRILRDR
jgi:hypothetical protein